MSNSELIEWLKKKAETVTMPGSRKMYQAAVKALEALPPAQPEIIRCKDCRHRDEFGCCKYWVGLTMGMPTTATDDDDFCSHAERSKT